MICSITAGRSSVKQYLPLKPTKREFKVWIIGDSKYFLDLQVYVGSEGEGTEHGLGERVVLGLTEQYRGVHHQLYCDNFFSSPRLCYHTKYMPLELFGKLGVVSPRFMQHHTSEGRGVSETE